MLPAKIKGLNEDSSDESGDEEEERRCNRITKEALEQNMQQVYREALKLQKQNNFVEAERLLQQLLDNDLLSQAEGKVKYVNNRIQPSLMYLKYCCHLNLGSIYSHRGEYIRSLDNYITATELDDTDLNLWYRMGNVAVKIPNYSLAICAFNQALKRNARHWPSLESIIDATYATGDMMACLCYISHSLNLDPSYLKGRVLKRRILRKHSFLAKDYGVFFPNSSTVKSTPFIYDCDEKEKLLLSENEENDEDESNSLLKEITELECHMECIKKVHHVQSVFNTYLETKTWNNLANLLLRVYHHLNESDPTKFFNKIKIEMDRNVPGDFTSTATMTQCDEFLSVPIASAIKNTSDVKTIDNRDTGLIFTTETGVATATAADVQKLMPTSDKEMTDIGSKTTIRKRKSSPTLADQLKICDKRRSTRNKTILKNNEPSLSKTLHNLIPADLLPTKENSFSNANTSGTQNDTLLRWSEDSFDTMDIYRLLFEYQEENDIPSFPVNDLSDATRIKLLSEERYFDTDKETSDVEWFVKLYGNEELNVLELIDSYCKEVSAKWHHTWPKKLTDNFLKMARILSQHSFRNDRLHVFRLCENGDNVATTNIDSDDNKQKLKLIEEEANFLLMYGELLLNERFDSSDDTRQQQQNNSDCESYILGDEFNTLLLGDLRDACYHLRDTNVNDKLWIRSLWLRALMFVQRKDTFAACSALSSLVEDTWWLSSDENTEIRLPNMIQLHSITVTGATRLLNTLQRNKNLNEVRLFFASKRYDRVAKILEDTLKPSGKRLMRLPNENTLPRYYQYELLMASLWQLKNYKELFKWCEVCCYEAFTIYRKSFFDDTDSATKSKWAALLVNALAVMLSCIQIEGIVQIVDTLKPEYLSRLVQTLTNLICHQIESSEPCPEIIADCVTPWLLLVNFVDYHEKKQQSYTTSVGDENDVNSSSNFDTPLVSSAVSLLLIAHEFLGRRCWCCFDDGALLFYTLSVIEPILEKCGTDGDGSDVYSQTRLTLSQQVDQIFYCLYSHPFKKNKPRHVQEHNSLGLALTWNRAIQAYSYYRPNSLPQFDAASKSCTISADTETLFKRIVPLVPEEQNPSSFLESINQYLSGSIERIPPLRKDNVNDESCNKNEYKSAAREVADLYYLLGDYYFKNKIMATAIKYYLYDICWNSSRFDSWAAMALARGSQLEMKFNSCETISNEQEILNKAELTGKCFETALQLDRNQSSLWIEYGVFSYAIHAFCSRLLKQETTNLSLQMFDMLENRKNCFLKTSRHCFNSANKAWLEQTSKQEEVQDERWLNHYMLGKINEKTEEKPNVYLAHYYKASELLTANGAEYPTRIVYSSPQYYSVEALEIFYRIHASILKILDIHEEKMLDDSTLNTFSEYLTKMKQIPFIKTQIKSTKYQESVYTSSSGAVAIKGEKSKETNRNNDTKKNLTRDTDTVEIAECLDRLINEVVLRATDQQTTSCKRKANVNESLVTNEDMSVAKKSRQETNDCSCETIKRGSPVIKDAKGEEEGVNKNEAYGKIDAVDSNVAVACSKNLVRQNDIVSSSSSPIEKETISRQTWPHSADAKIATRHEEIKSRKSLVHDCVKALEECIRRFPEHYKSYYRLSSHYFRSKSERDIEKARKLLVETGGLFADRTSKNFFGGIWRIPTGEIDRAGSFAFHMSRSVHLLMDVLRDTRDYKTLLHLSDQLKIKPDLDKKYIRDNEREQLCKEALSLSGQALRIIIESVASSDSEENRRRLLLDVYKCYHRLSKNSTTHKDTIFGRLLVTVYQKYTNREDKVSFDQILAFCKSLNYASKMVSQPANATTTTTTTMLGEARYDFAKSIPQIINLMMNDRKATTAAITPTIPSSLLPYHNLSVNEMPSSQFKQKPPKMARSTSNFPSLASMNANYSLSVMPTQSSSLPPSSSSHFQPISWHKQSVAKSIAAQVRSDEEKDKGKCRTFTSFDCGVVSISAVPSSNQKKINNPPSLLQSMSTNPDVESGLIHRTDVINAAKERPNLVITPVLNCSSNNETGNRPTLQQKLAAKKMSNVAATASVSPTSFMKSLSSTSKNIIGGVMPSSAASIDVSKQLLTSSAISIFPVDRTSSVSTSSQISKFLSMKDSQLTMTVASPAVIQSPSVDNMYSSLSQPEHPSVTGRIANETFSKKGDKIDFKFINPSNSGLIIEPTTTVANKTMSSVHTNELRTKNLLKSLDNNPDLEVIPKNTSNIM